MTELNKIMSQNSNLYTKINTFNNFNLINRTFILNSFDSISTLKCFTICSKNPECFYIALKLNKCFICKFNSIFFLNYETGGDSLIYQKQFKITNGLINYWPFNENINDVIGSAHLYGGNNAGLTSDRFGRTNSALSLSTGYYNVPPGVYFSGTQFSFMAWVNVRDIGWYSRLIDFGNGANQASVLLTFSSETSLRPYLFFYSGSNYFSDSSTTALNPNQWQHLACVYSFPYYSIYIDGIETTAPGSKTNLASFRLENVIRSSNYVGRSNWGEPDADADFDDLKIFNRALTQNEIQFEMNNNL